MFELNGSNYHTENAAPYSISGDTSGNYDPWAIGLGYYTVKATPYSEKNGSGNAGVAKEISFSVVETSLPAGQTSDDVGSTGFGTIATFNNGAYLISASGKDIWGKADAFGFVHQDASGDVDLTANILSIENTNTWAKAGVMIRESLDANSTHAMTVITPAQGVSFQRRTNTGANSGHTTIGGVKAPEWVKVLRSGDKFTGYYSTDNTVWYPMNSVNMTMNTDVKVGLAVTSHDNTKEVEAMIDNFSVRNPAGSLFVTNFYLVNADTNEDIRELHHEATINLATDGLNLSIRAETSGIEESVVFHINGAKTQTESVAPYAIAGDTNGSYKAWTPALGSNTIMATPHSEAAGAGSAGTSLAIVIEVIDQP